MRNKRSRGIKFKKGKIYTIKRLTVLALLLLIFVLIIKLMFFNTKTKPPKVANSQNNLQTNQAQNFSSENNVIDKSLAENSSNEISNKNAQENTSTEFNQEDITFSMAVTGDIMCHNTNYQDAYNSSTKSYDFSYYFDDIKGSLQSADITIGNLETTFAGSKRGYSGYPTFNTPEVLAKNLKKAGFNVVTTANNHCMDKGYSGLESTINFLDEADLAHTGTFKSGEDQKNILIKNVKGVSIAFLSFTYGTNGIPIPTDKPYAVNLIDKKLMKQQIRLAKEQNPDLICVSMHWGIEYQTSANKEQKELADFLFENGVDVILGNHSHVPQQMEKRKIKLEDGTTKDGFVIYSLGNFMSAQNKQYTKDSAILRLEITKHKEDGKISIDTVTYTPTYMYKNPSKKSKAYKVLDIKRTIAAYEAKDDTSIGKSTYNTLKTELKNIKKIIGDEIK